MNHSRRPIERRRRVILTTVGGDSGNVTAKQRAVQQQWREARRPAVAYGSRVRRCLRGRWFSLVPVQRSALTALFAIVFGVSAILIGLQYASIAWPALAERTAITAVTRIDASGSLGRYCTSVLMMGVAGASWLVYQLRRYRNDDFQGHYRLWRLVTAMAMLGSVATMVPLIELLGGITEWLLGKRVALSGSDWVKLLLTVGGAVMFLRTTAELWKQRIAAGWMMAGWAAALLPVAENWNLIAIDSPWKWTAFTSAMLVASACWFCATVMYLRTLFMDVRGIQRPPSMATRIRMASNEQWEGMVEWTKRAKPVKRTKPEKANPSETEDKSEESAPARRVATKNVAVKKVAREEVEEAPAENETDEVQPRARKRRFWQRSAKSAEKTEATDESSQEVDSREDQVGAVAEDGNADQGDSKPSKWKFWARRRRSMTDSSENEAEERVETNEELASADLDEPKAEAKPKRRWLPTWKKRKESADASETESDDVSVAEESSDSEAEETKPKKRRFGLKFPSLRRQAKSDDGTDDDEDESQAEASHEPRNSDRSAQPSANDDSFEEEELNEDDIDWSSMSKAERRRVRKQLKRSGRAA
ncbi:hypothetical protein LOC71_02860 [Rhodopirellula sp. JC740]|uniref:Uncharacterized protein n=1 Tax=Rhodopirellula halodulae TaxID=2894198 RepID=A0ABS8NCS2_9BACT|nr:hypothetical protein [Rhodopirellula sp. JC740]MCC9641199.1 hypothetical protein [Rhodopirellula sp. JC740]